MKSLIDYSDAIKSLLQEFDIVLVCIRDSKGGFNRVCFHKGQDIGKKCEFMNSFLGEKNIVIEIEGKYE